MSKMVKKRQGQQSIAAKNNSLGYSNFVYVFASTLNQMVNYIPWRKFDFKEARALTITDNKEFDNNKWNTHLKEVIGKTFEEIEIAQAEMLSIKDVKDTLIKNIPNEPVFWNVTGGQRPFLFAVNQLVTERPNDRICYLEGTTNKLIIMKADGSTEATMDYSIEEDMTIEIALKLMGFDIKDSEKRKQSFHDLKNDSDKKLYLKLIEQICLNNALRELFIRTNKLKDKKTKKKIDRQVVKQQLLDNLAKDIFTENEIKKIDNLIDFKKETYPFGYILERMVGFKIIEAVGDKIVDMSMSESLYFTDKEQQKSGGGSSIDEFDIAVLTKTGQFIIIECKSGGMSSDIAKSTKYSTYAAAGVYAKPILVTPLKQDEIKDLKNNVIADGIFDSIKSAIRSANRATLEVWGIDEIVGKIENKLDV